MSFKKVGFNSDINRFYVKANGVPGPGGYIDRDKLEKVLAKQASYNQA